LKRFATVVLSCAVVALSWTLATDRSPARADASDWPQTESVQGYTMVEYQPQVVTWTDDKHLTGRMALSITKQGSTNKPVFGVINLTADTRADYTQRIVVISNVRFVGVDFPELSADQRQQLTDFINRYERFGNRVVPLDGMLAATVAARNAARTVQLSTTPPDIDYSASPAILVAFDGDPVFGPVKGANDLQFGVNTNWNVFKTGGVYYLLDGASWLQASALNGPWKAAGALPAALRQLPDDPNWSTARAALDAPAPSAVPTVWIATKPAEAIVTNGAPKLVAIAGTQLTYVDNTQAALFFDRGTKQYYYLTSGRWFAAANLSGPWSFAGQSLPADFAKIPVSSPRGWVLASVPGTPQAQTAILAADVPHSAAITRMNATLSVTYGGPPNWQPIAGTPLQYAANTSFDVIKDGNAYYACSNAVWFTATSPNGPWTVADSIPDEIYQIPSNSPLYPDTYVTVETSDTNTVTYEYTAGYLSNYAWNNGYYYGTGWWAPPYIGEGALPVYYGWPATYVGGTYYNTATSLYARGYGVVGPYGGARSATGYNPATGNFWHASSVYGPYGGIGHVAVYNPASGEYSHADGAWGPRGVVTGGGNIYGSRAYAGTTYTRADSVSPYGAWGSVARPYDMATANAARAAGVADYATTGATGDYARNDVYAGSDGNVYRPGASSGWDRYSNTSGSWNSSRSYQSTNYSQLSHDQMSRSMGGFGGARGR
jgi:hypothetical protein